jgi:hypothetical protein
MCESRKATVVGHIVNMINHEDNHGLKFYFDLIRGDKEVINEINLDLNKDPEACQLITKNAPEFINLR